MAEVEAHVVQEKNERQAQIAHSNLSVNLVKIACNQDEEMKRVEAQMAPKCREAELQTELNTLQAATQEVRTCQ
jgi:hypothetical protein